MAEDRTVAGAKALSSSLWIDFLLSRVEVLFAVVFGFVGATALLFSFARVRGRRGQLAEHYVFAVLLIGAGVGVVLAQNLVLAFVLWEVATIAVWRLVAVGRRAQDVAAGNWALYLNFAATALMLVGLGFLLTEHKAVNFTSLRGLPLSGGVAVLLLAGILAKSATLPLHIWLPRAYGAASAPACALLSGIAENIGIVLFYRLFSTTFAVPAAFLRLSANLALISSLVAGAAALRSRSVRELLAYSTVSQLGLILLGLAVGGYYGILGALLYVAAHAIAKAGLFYAVGVVQDDTTSDGLLIPAGVSVRSPTLAVAAAVLVFSVIGLPPTVGFAAKFGVLVGAGRFDLLLAAGGAATALLTLLYMVRFYSGVFLGSGHAQPAQQVSRAGVALVVLIALVTVLGGFGWFIPVRWITGSQLGVGLP